MTIAGNIVRIVPGLQATALVGENLKVVKQMWSKKKLNKKKRRKKEK